MKLNCIEVLLWLGTIKGNSERATAFATRLGKHYLIKASVRSRGLVQTMPEAGRYRQVMY